MSPKEIKEEIRLLIQELESGRSVMKYQRILTYLALYNAILADEIYSDQIIETEASCTAINIEIFPDDWKRDPRSSLFATLT